MGSACATIHCLSLANTGEIVGIFRNLVSLQLRSITEQQVDCKTLISKSMFRNRAPVACRWLENEIYSGITATSVLHCSNYATSVLANDDAFQDAYPQAVLLPG